MRETNALYPRDACKSRILSMDGVEIEKRPHEAETNPMDLWAYRGNFACGKLSRRNTKTRPWTSMTLDMVVITQVSHKKERVTHCTACV